MNRTEGAVAYVIGKSLYLNITNRCTAACSFCVRSTADGVDGHYLWLAHEPSVEEIVADIHTAEKEHNCELFAEYVFCGYGEPLLRLDVVKAVSEELKARGAKVRLNTNGHGNLIAGRNVVPELVGRIDTASVSLNAHDAVAYDNLVHSVYGPDAYGAMVYFAEQCRLYLPRTVLTVVSVPGVDVPACRAVAEAVGAELRVRSPISQ